MYDLRTYYRDIMVGETVQFNGERKRSHEIQLVELKGAKAEIRIDDETIELTTVSSDDVGDKASDNERQYVRRGTLQVGIDITREFVADNAYEKSMISLSGDARVYIGPVVAYSHAKYRFPVPRQNWDYSSNWLTTAPYGRHLGIDLGAPRGTQAISVCDGVIQDIRRYDPAADSEDYWGHLVAIRGKDGFIYTYAHCDTLAPHVEIGAAIQRGNAIGSIGKSGFESMGIAPHLHFEMLACRRPENFRFAFERKPSEQSTPIRLLPDDAEGFVVNPFPYLCEWFQAQ
ncbi:MAG: peptidoglycan DD-metalloendopeptidase family protein [Chitinivibrionales bacterium]|nr:peptidoglycan DD-metalloendopeptidase family protein [Chitinivibrionales bacterium]MBD3356526.1 peptidoglycan DD-metalloendopeptidase family protein [Chitinivibrionales bacterium]